MITDFVKHDYKPCTMCDHAAYEDAQHLIMSCPATETLRTSMFKELAESNECGDLWRTTSPENILETMLERK